MKSSLASFFLLGLELVALIAALAWGGPPLLHLLEEARVERAGARLWEQTQTTADLPGVRGESLSARPRPRLPCLSHSAQPAIWLQIPRLDIETLVLRDAQEADLHYFPHLQQRLVGDTRSAPFLFISGHRDLHFRPLREIREGDLITIETPERGRQTYRVKRREIVEEAALADVIRHGETPGTLALVTCYPFYFVGEAPQRFIAWAEPESHERPLT